jgi:membrane protease YdiL (CAAX protease family)
VVWAFAAVTSSYVLEAGQKFNLIDGTIEPAIIIAISIVNPIFEECFLCGYLVTALKDRTGSWTAINISVGIRLICHLYQGIIGVIFIVPFGLIFTYWYARRGRLWPLIVAHALFDFFPLFTYANN